MVAGLSKMKLGTLQLDFGRGYMAVDEPAAAIVALDRVLKVMRGHHL